MTAYLHTESALIQPLPEAGTFLALSLHSLHAMWNQGYLVSTLL